MISLYRKESLNCFSQLLIPFIGGEVQRNFSHGKALYLVVVLSLEAFKHSRNAGEKSKTSG